MVVLKGHVKWFDTSKGYGFLVVEDGSGDILLHANVLKNFVNLLILGIFTNAN